MEEIHYRIPWRAGGQRPGHHRGRSAGPGFEFIAHAPLLAAPDPRRLDVRASLTDPFGEWKVRVFRQRAALPVWVVADLSASMGYAGRRRKQDVLADFIACLAYSAWRTGDRFGCLACDAALRREFSLPSTRQRGAGVDLAERLRRADLRGDTAQALLEAHGSLARERALVFLVSDFHFPVDFTQRVVESFAGHDLVPVVIWDPEEYRHLPRFGWVTLRDPESGAVRTLLMRARLRERIRQRFEDRRAALAALFGAAGREPLFLEHGFHADRVTEYFHGGTHPHHGA